MRTRIRLQRSLFFLSVALVMGFAYGLEQAYALNGLFCSSADGQLRLKTIGYNSGVPPMPGTVVETTTWTFRDEVLANYEVHLGMPAPAIDLQVKFDQQTRVQLSEERRGPAGYTLYAIKVNLEKKRSETETWTYSDYLICKRTYALIP